jgi:hypothetical protein
MLSEELELEDALVLVVVSAVVELLVSDEFEPHAASESVIDAASDKLSTFLTFLDFIMKILLVFVFLFLLMPFKIKRGFKSHFAHAI